VLSDYIKEDIFKKLPFVKRKLIGRKFLCSLESLPGFDNVIMFAFAKILENVTAESSN
jgi:hypothetical protein